MGYMDLSNVLENMEAPHSQLPITPAVVGVNDQLIFSKENQNLVFMKGVNCGLHIVPLLHLNLLAFKNMKPRKEYLHFARWGDKLKALGLDNKVYTWSMETGNYFSSE